MAVLLTCPVCLNTYDMADRKPVTLSACGHGMCDKCYLKPPPRLSLQKGFPLPLRCPSCGLDNTKANLNTRNTNIDVLELIRTLRQNSIDLNGVLALAQRDPNSKDTTIPIRGSDRAAKKPPNDIDLSLDAICPYHLRPYVYDCMTCTYHRKKCAECVMGICKTQWHEFKLLQTPTGVMKSKLNDLKKLVQLQQSVVTHKLVNNLSTTLEQHLDQDSVKEQLDFYAELSKVYVEGKASLRIADAEKINKKLLEFRERAKIESMDTADSLAKSYNEEELNKHLTTVNICLDKISERIRKKSA